MIIICFRNCIYAEGMKGMDPAVTKHHPWHSTSASLAGVIQYSLVVPEGSVPFAPADFCGGIRRTGGALVDREAAVFTCGREAVAVRRGVSGITPSWRRYHSQSTQ